MWFNELLVVYKDAGVYICAGITELQRVFDRERLTIKIHEVDRKWSTEFESSLASSPSSPAKRG